MISLFVLLSCSSLTSAVITWKVLSVTQTKPWIKTVDWWNSFTMWNKFYQTASDHWGFYSLPQCVPIPTAQIFHGDIQNYLKAPLHLPLGLLSRVPKRSWRWYTTKENCEIKSISVGEMPLTLWSCLYLQSNRYSFIFQR